MTSAELTPALCDVRDVGLAETTFTDKLQCGAQHFDATAFVVLGRGRRFGHDYGDPLRVTEVLLVCSLTFGLIEQTVSPPKA